MSDHFSLTQSVTVFVVGSVAILVIGIQPVLLGQLLETSMVDMSNVGYLASVEIAMVGIGLTLASLLFSLKLFRKIAGVMLLTLAVLNFISANCDTYAALLFCRSLAGLVSGTLLWIVTCVIVRMPRPAMSAGIFIASHTAAQGLAAFVLATMVIPEFGWRGCFILMIVTSMIPLPLLGLMPNSVTELARSTVVKGRISMSVMLTSLTIVLHLILIVGLWAYLEPLGQRAGAPSSVVQVVVAASLAVQIVGAGAAAFFSSRSKALPVLLFGTVFMSLFSVYIFSIVHFDPKLFVPAALAFSFVWMFLTPFHTKIAFDVDPTGRLAQYVPALQTIGAALGPILAGIVIGTGFVTDIAMLSGACSAFAILCIFSIWILRRFAKKAELPELGI